MFGSGKYDDIWLVDWFDLPKLSALVAASHAFEEARSLVLSSMMIVYWLIWSTWIWVSPNRFFCILWGNKFKNGKYDDLMIDWRDLPQLSKISFGCHSFTNTKTISLSSNCLMKSIHKMFLSLMDRIQRIQQMEIKHSNT